MRLQYNIESSKNQRSCYLTVPICCRDAINLLMIALTMKFRDCKKFNMQIVDISATNWHYHLTLPLIFAVFEVLFLGRYYFVIKRFWFLQLIFAFFLKLSILFWRSNVKIGLLTIFSNILQLVILHPKFKFGEDCLKTEWVITLLLFSRWPLLPSLLYEFHFWSEGR